MYSIREDYIYFPRNMEELKEVIADYKAKGIPGAAGSIDVVVRSHAGHELSKRVWLVNLWANYTRWLRARGREQGCCRCPDR
jgi:hypothetical protein